MLDLTKVSRSKPQAGLIPTHTLSFRPEAHPKVRQPAPAAACKKRRFGRDGKGRGAKEKSSLGPQRERNQG